MLGPRMKWETMSHPDDDDEGPSTLFLREDAGVPATGSEAPDIDLDDAEDIDDDNVSDSLDV